MKQVANLQKTVSKFPIFVSVGLHAELLYLLILGDHTIGHSKRKSIYVHVSYSETAISLYSSKFSNTGIYCSSGKAGKVYLV
jgi:hypothetical protein